MNERYDWWRLENGEYAKIPRQPMLGQIYTTEGEPKGLGQWNPLNLKNLDNKERDLKNRKSSIEDKGWPEWTK